jgi:adenine specific DNA methylase Mod
VTKQPSVLEEHAYRDTWGRGRASYLSMMFERLALIHELLSGDGSFCLYCAPNVSHYLNLACDKIFGADQFRSEIVWKRSSAHSDVGQGRRQYGSIHDVILFYTKGTSWVWNPQYTEYDTQYVDTKYRNIEPETGRR